MICTHLLPIIDRLRAEGLLVLKGSSGKECPWTIRAYSPMHYGGTRADITIAPATLTLTYQITGQRTRPYNPDTSPGAIRDALMHSDIIHGPHSLRRAYYTPDLAAIIPGYVAPYPGKGKDAVGVFAGELIYLTPEILRRVSCDPPHMKGPRTLSPSADHVLAFLHSVLGSYNTKALDHARIADNLFPDTSAVIYPGDDLDLLAPCAPFDIQWDSRRLTAKPRQASCEPRTRTGVNFGA